MPRSHYPIKGGAQVQFRSGGAGRAADDTGGCAQCRNSAAEIERLQQQVSRLKSNTEGGGGARMPGHAMMWAALGICGIGLLFAIAAILRH